MQRLSAPILGLLAALVFATPALAGSGSTTFGVSDTRPVGMADDGAKFFKLMNHVGLTEDRLTVLWNPQRPMIIPRFAELRRAVTSALAHNVTIAFSVSQKKAGSLSSSPTAPDQFATFLQLLANHFPEVTGSGSARR